MQQHTEMRRDDIVGSEVRGIGVEIVVYLCEGTRRYKVQQHKEVFPAVTRGSDRDIYVSYMDFYL